jgi:hypothetical protein
LIETVHGGLPLSLLLGLPARPAGVSPAAASPVSVPVWPGGLHPPELRGTGFTSLALRLPGRLRLALLRRLLDSLPAAVYRAKGVLVTVADDAPQLLSFVCGRWDVRDLPRLRDVMTETQLVLIGDGLGPLEAELRARFAACMEPGGAPLLPLGVRRP